MFWYDKDMERVMQHKKREIIRELEALKCKLLKELSGVDKITLTRLREILADYNRIDFNLNERLNAHESRFSEMVKNADTAIERFENEMDYMTIKPFVFKTVNEMLNFVGLKNGDVCITIGNGIDEANCIFNVSDVKKDDLSVELYAGLYANIIGNSVNLTALSTNPFSLLPVALSANYNNIEISGDHTINETIEIANIHNKCEVKISGRITLNTTLFKVTNTNNLHFTGGIYYGNDNILFYVPQETDADRGSFTACNMWLKKCQLVKLCNSTGYMRFYKIAITEDTVIPFEIDGTGLTISPNFVYFSNCSMGGNFKINKALNLYFDNCDFVNTAGELTNVTKTVFTSCNFITRGRTNTFNETKSVSFVGCIFETDSTESLMVFNNNCRGLSINGIAIAVSGRGLLIDTTNMQGYIKLDLKPTYISPKFSSFIAIGEGVTVDTYFPIIKETLGSTGRVPYSHPEVNCEPNIVFTIPQAPARYEGGYIYIEGEQGTEYTIVTSHS